MRFTHFSGLFGEDYFDTEQAIHLESLQKRSAVHQYEIAQHVHSDLAQLFFIEKGLGKIDSEGVHFPFDAPCILFIPSGILHGFSFSENIAGEVLTMNATLFENCLQGLPNIPLHFQELKLLPFRENLTSFDQLMGTRQRFHNELAERHPAREKIIELLLQILIVRLYRLVLDHDNLILTHKNRTMTHFRQLVKYTQKHASNTLSVSDCSNYMNMSSGHLNRICKAVAQKTTQMVLHEQLASKAKRLLLTSDNSVAEIAYLLGFKDPSHFSKFFKNKEGITPTRLRKKIKESSTRIN